MKDYYTILGINKAATDEDVKKAYRKLAHQYHPDKQGGDEKKFKEVNEAYQILSNKEKRVAYDRFGSADFSGGFPGGSPFGGGGFPGFDGVHFDVGGMGDVSDIFDAFFEGLGVKPRRKSYARGADLEVAEAITLEEAFNGVKKKISFRAPIKCAACNGDGANTKAGSATCGHCEGRGEIRETKRTFFGEFAQVKSCGKCNGRGSIPNEICKVCKGEGRTVGGREVVLDVLPGVQDGQIIQIAGAGEAGERGASAGDLYVRIAVKPHERFMRAGENMAVNVPLDLTEALLKDEIYVTGIDGKKIVVKIPPGFNFGERVVAHGEGMPRFNSRGRGDLVVNFKVIKPKKIDPKLKKLLENE